ncbi:hypothetical protein JX265_007659 [Neoarthrinium moseri]|uniref:Clr5 domain-containing protein n=1 Tax=Neoarthrinium moseri TaxID=1658444 RepID=A0A9P9WJX3_9PEZI|nr:uncharacterized protein JN550_012971 [Neoarthrinium moseri]KAI1854471.1 hypothetical protein JX266_000589 [Neoarthrinium moseri]KAI1857896.1 hypothetical protein JN550_012971 [Neoarthrinium moseri]KAI1867083.1 hypothetical protein JX265_007659 [Neoarthrinium moseri]
MALAVRPKSDYASRLDWDLHRDTITRLYWDERKTLKEVADFMEKEHDFYATLKMYKSRIKNWGLTKNLKSQEAERIKTKVDQGATPTLPVIRGRQIGSKRFKRHLNQVQPHSPTNQLVARRHTHSASPPIPQRLKSPKLLKEAEDCIQAIMSYTSSRFDDHIWDLSSHDYNWGGDTASSWWVDMWVVSDLIEQRRSSPEGFELLEECFDRYGTLIVNQHPGLVSATLCTILQLGGVGPELAESLLRYVAGLSQIKLGPAHPFTRLWTVLVGMGLPQIRQAAFALMTAHMDVIRANTEPGQRFRTIADVHITRRLARFAGMPIQAANGRVFNLAKEIAENMKSDNDIQWLNFTAFIKGAILVDGGLYQEADNYLETIRDDLFGWGRNTENFYGQKGRIMVGLGEYDKGIECFQKGLDIVTKWDRRDLSQEAFAYHHMRNAYRLKGDVEGEEKMKIKFLTSWNSLVSQIRAGRLHPLD